MPMTGWLNTPWGWPQGGFIALLADTALGWRCRPPCRRQRAFAQIDLKVNYLRPVAPDGRLLHAHATVAHRGRSSPSPPQRSSTKAGGALPSRPGLRRSSNPQRVAIAALREPRGGGGPAEAPPVAVRRRLRRRRRPTRGSAPSGGTARAHRTRSGGGRPPRGWRGPGRETGPLLHARHASRRVVCGHERRNDDQRPECHGQHRHARGDGLRPQEAACLVVDLVPPHEVIDPERDQWQSQPHRQCGWRRLYDWLPTTTVVAMPSPWTFRHRAG